MQKYEIITDQNDENYGHIRALTDFGDVKKGDIGGKIDSYANLSQEDNCWVGYDARVCDDAKVYGNAWVYGNAKVFDNASVYDNARVYGSSEVFRNAEVYKNAKVYGNARVYDNAKVTGDVES